MFKILFCKQKAYQIIDTIFLSLLSYNSPDVIRKINEKNKHCFHQTDPNISSSMLLISSSIELEACHCAVNNLFVPGFLANASFVYPRAAFS